MTRAIMTAESQRPSADDENATQRQRSESVRAHDFWRVANSIGRRPLDRDRLRNLERRVAQLEARR